MMKIPMVCALVGVVVAGCGGDDPVPFSIQFAATNGTQAVGCADPMTGLGPAGDVTVGLSDLRFYISNLRLFDADGAELDVALDDSEFQYNSDAGSVVLIDLTSNTEGTCADTAISFAEGTARTNDRVRGEADDVAVARVSFDVGVPQAVMKDVIATNTAEAAPSPLNEMYWSWASGYRHFVLNFTVDDGAGDTGDGYVHVGSRDCGAEGSLALEDREVCGLINTPQVSLGSFDPATGVVAVDVPALLSGLDFVAPIYDPDTREQIGEGPGVECHSAPQRQPDCESIFSSLGVEPSTGAALSANNAVFGPM